jgi:hypothetical protein
MTSTAALVSCRPNSPERSTASAATRDGSSLDWSADTTANAGSADKRAIPINAAAACGDGPFALTARYSSSDLSRREICSDSAACNEASAHEIFKAAGDSYASSARTASDPPMLPSALSVASASARLEEPSNSTSTGTASLVPRWPSEFTSPARNLSSRADASAVSSARSTADPGIVSSTDLAAYDHGESFNSGASTETERSVATACRSAKARLRSTTPAFGSSAVFSNASSAGIAARVQTASNDISASNQNNFVVRSRLH